MNTHRIAEILVDKGKALFDSPRNIVTFTGDIQADTLLNDLENTPHALFLRVSWIGKLRQNWRG
jgi:hypothetical protein